MRDKVVNIKSALDPATWNFPHHKSQRLFEVYADVAFIRTVEYLVCFSHIKC